MEKIKSELKDYFPFFAIDNWWFQRLENGDVRIGKKRKVYIIIPNSVWASIVCSVSKSGEEFGRWYIANEFHNSTTAEILGRSILRLNRKEVLTKIEKESV